MLFHLYHCVLLLGIVYHFVAKPGNNAKCRGTTTCYCWWVSL